MSVITFDTCIFITYQPSYLPKGFRLTAVVLQELTAGANDDKEVKYWNEVRRAREKDGTLLVPNDEDWWLAGKVLNSLQRALRGSNQGKIPKSDPATIQRITRDVLIARTAKRAGAMLVTDNTKDFELIKNFCNVKTISGKDFFEL
jgi:predicted nucleic acid-binding protein